MQRRTVLSGAPWEATVGYSRAIRIGNHVWVAGTTAAATDGVVGGGSAALQTREILRRIENALNDVDAVLADVVRTRMFVTDIARWEEIGVEHGRVFGAVQPVSTMVQVAALVEPELLVEIEVDAFLAR